ncbi:MAG: hypothetical protein AVO33_06495 [delta proteobacterium ML8_F1]|nr:MAG: hypothetical protein AVO33_06495 [delta proteobacterium ML8_F1]
MSIVNLSLQILPVVPEERIYPVVDRVIEMIQATGLPHVVGPLDTTIEGELEELLDIVKKAQAVCLEEGADRIVSVIKIDYKKEGVTIDEKISKYRG